MLYSAAPAPAPAPDTAAVQTATLDPIMEVVPEILAAPQSPPADVNSPPVLSSDSEAAPLGLVLDTVADGFDLIVIDPAIPDAESLIAKLSRVQSDPNRLLILDSQHDGLQQIADRLELLGETRAVHILSHGDEAGLRLGSNWLSSDTLGFRANTLASWQPYLSSNADILFYGCDLAATESGQEFLRSFGQLTGTDIAASTNATGAALLGGDWNLEFQAGSIEAQSLGQQLNLFDWNGLLTSNSYQEGVSSYSGTQDTSISAANPGTSTGTSGLVIVGGAEQQTGLIRFDNLFGNGPNQIPLGSTILSASLRLNVTSATDPDALISLNRVLSSWSESSTYNSLGSGLSRDDIDVATVADAVITTPAALGVQTVDGLEQAVQAWSNGATNFGWAIYGDNSSSWAFMSSEGATASLRPMLLVSYTPPAPVAVELRTTGEMRVNAATTDVQSTLVDTRNAHNSVGIDANGNYVVVWTSSNSDGSGMGVFAQRYNARGVAQGRPILVNTTTAGDQKWANVAVKSDGGFIVTWTSDGQDGSGLGVYGRIFTAAGVGGAEFQVNTTTTGSQQSPAIGVAANGTFVIAWQGAGAGDSDGIFAQRFNSSGSKAGSEILVNTTTLNTQYDPSIAVGQDGQFMVVWDDVTGTLGRRFKADGKAKDTLQLQIHADATSGNADVATNGTGDYHIVWRTTGGGDGSGRGLWQMSLGSADIVPGTRQLVTNDTINDQTEPAISSDADGNYIVTWQGSGRGDTSGVFARKFLNDGTAVGSEYQLNETTVGNQVGVSTALLNLNNYVAVWSGNGPGDTDGIFLSAEGTLKNQASLLFTTSSNVNSSGSSSLSNWTTGDVLALGQPNLSLGTNTSGALSIVGNINAIANDGNVSIAGLDVIQHDVLVAAGAHQVQLYAGDVLFSVAGTETLGSLTVQSDDILIFRPAAPWNYAAGSISVLFDGIQSLAGNTVQSMADFDLVDTDTQVGDVLLSAGTLIVADSGGSGNVIQVVHPTSAGLTTTAGTTQTLFKQTEISSGQKIVGLQLVERDIQVGGVNLQSGDLLVSTQNSTTLGANTLSVTQNDVARLQIDTTSLNGTASVTASMLIRGSDISLDSSAESFAALAMVHVGDPPTAQGETYQLTQGQDMQSQDSWHMPGWSSRMQLTFDNASRSENLVDFPILVTLDTNRFDYSLAQANGADLRFVDANGTVLSYEIENWNPNGESHIWVKVPQIDANSNSDSIWLYYGNSAAPSAQNAADVWSNGYVGVWHMNGNPSGSLAIQDSSASNVDGTATGMDATNQINGPIGGALQFDGVSEYIRVPTTSSDPTAVNPSQLTIEAWADSTGDTGTWERIVNRRNIVFLFPYESYGLATSSTDGTQLVNTTGTPDLMGTSGSLPADNWRYVTGTLSGSTSNLYVNGALNATATGVTSLGSNNDDITIGAGEMGLSSAVSQYWKGGIDEVRLSNVARSAAWTAAQYASMTDSMITYGDRQTVAGLLDNDTSAVAGGLSISRVDLSGVSDFASVSVLDNGQFYVHLGDEFDSLAAGQTATRQIQYAVMDSYGNSDLATATFQITGSNDAPVINTAVGPLKLNDILEDAGPNAGTTVAQILASAPGTLITDVDTGAVQGIAVTGVDSTNGTWEFSLNGTSWVSLASVSVTNATLLNPAASVRFIPNSNFNGAAGSITFRAWDQTTGTNGQTGVDVSVSGGSTAFSDQATTASITATPVNDTPTLTVGFPLNLPEGGQITITSSSLNATDVESSASQLTYSVTGGLGVGRLALVTAPATAITTFTQAQINSNQIIYIHSGAETYSDYVSVSVTDGTAAVTGTLTFTISPVNDPPTFDANRITLNEGQTVTLSSFNLLTNDPDTAATSLVYTVNSVTGGRFERSALPGTAIATFTQDDVNNSRIRFVHDGGEAAPTSNLTVTDGNSSVGPRSMAVIFTNVNDAPTISSISDQNQRAGVSTSALAFTVGDAETAAGSLVVTASTSDAVRIPLSGIVLSGTGANRMVTVTPAPTATAGTVRITLTVSDGTMTTSTGFNVAILADPAPQAVNDLYTIYEDTTLDTQASGWWNSLWTTRQKLTLDNSTRAEALTNFPILVTLDASNFDYSSSAAGGADLRFIDRDGTVLNYDIETWNPTGTSRIWVSVPQIDASSNSDYLWMYSGNGTATAGANPLGVWGAGFEAVYHFTPDATAPGTLQDATNRFDGSISGATSVSGLIGGAYSFDGVNQRVVLPTNSPILMNKSAISFSGWVRPGDLLGLQDILSIGVNNPTTLTDSRFAVILSGANIETDVRTSDSSSAAQVITTTSPLVANQWQYLSVVVDFVNNRESLYLDGASIGTVNGIFLNPSTPNTTATYVSIGSQDSGSGDFFNGLLDEMRLQSVVRSANWINAEYASMTGHLVTMSGQYHQAGVLDNDSDPQQENLTATLLTSPTHARNFTFNGYGSFVYTPADNFSGDDSFTYEAVDTFGNTSTASVTIHVNPVPDPPQTTGIPPVSVNEDSANTVIRLSDYFSDPDGDALTYALDSNSNSSLFSSVTINALSTELTLDYAENQSGAASLVLRATDSTGRSTTTTLLVNVTAVNDSPVISTNAGMTLTEGATLAFTPSMLTTSDVDNSATQLTYSLSSAPLHGRLEKTTAPGAAITSFKQSDINAGLIRYVHDGGESANDGFAFSVSDGGATTTGSFAITVTPVNDPPSLTVNTLAVSEGQTVVLTSSNLDAADPDSTSLTFVVSGVAHGQFANSATGANVTSFTRADLLAGIITFTHDGGETPPTAQISVTDGALSTTPVAVAFTYTPVDDAPVVSTNLGLTLPEGGNALIGSSLLTTTDGDNNPAQLTYTIVSSPANGRLERVSNPGVSIVSLTQEQIDSGVIQYVHDGGETSSDSFSFTVSDGLIDTSGSFAITITPVNDPPSVSVNSALAVNEGGTVLLTPAQLSASDSDNSASQLVYTLTSLPGHGRFERVASPGIAITSFTQSDVDSGAIRYRHDGSESSTDSIRFALFDGSASAVGDLVISITPVNDPPALAVNTGATVAEGATTTISSPQLSGTDVDNGPSELIYTVTIAPTNGRLEMAGNPGIAITSFTQADINGGAVQYVHDGSNTTADRFNFSLSDGSLALTGSFLITVNPVNDAPVIAINAGVTVSEGGIAVLGNRRLSTTDSDNTPAQLAYTLTTGPAHGRLERIASPGAAITTFTQADIDNGSLQYVHDGGETTADSFGFTVSDGTTSLTGTFSIAVTPVNDAPVLATNLGATVNEGGTVSIGNSQLLVTDVDNVPGQLVYSLTTAPVHGRLETSANPGVAITSFTQDQINGGTIRYVNDGSEFTSDAFSFSVSDGSASISGSFAITITAVNDAPVLTTASISIVEGQAITLSSSNFGASDPDTTVLTYLVTGVTHGQFINTSTGLAVTSFTNTELQSGLIQFTHDGSQSPPTALVSVSDGTTATTATAVTIAFTTVNDPPVVVVNTGATVIEGGSLVLDSTMLAATDEEQSASQLIYTVTVSPTGGRLEKVGNPGVAVVLFTQADLNSGSLRYVHLDGEGASDSFQFSLSDGTSAVTGQFLFAVTPVNDPPALVLGPLAISQGGSVAVTRGAVDATDPDSSVLTFTVSSVTHGQFRNTTTGLAVTSFTTTLLDAGRIVFVHDGSESPPTGLIRVSDGLATTSNQSLIFSYTNVNNAPVVANQTFQLAENSAPGTLIGQVVASDSDIGDRVTYSIATGPSSSLFTINAVTGAISVASGAALDFETQPLHTLTVQAQDLAGATSTATISLQLTNVNESPVGLVLRPVIGPEDGPVLTVDLTRAFVDPDGELLAYRIVSKTNPNLLGQITIDGSGQLVTVGQANANGTCDLTIEATDAGGLTARSTVTIQLTPVNDAPVAAGESIYLVNAQSITFDPATLLQNDTDVDGDRLSLEIVTQPAHGTLVANSDGTFTYLPDSGFGGSDDIQYVVSDGTTTSSPVTVNIDVQLIASSFGAGTTTNSSTGFAGSNSSSTSDSGSTATTTGSTGTTSVTSSSGNSPSIINGVTASGPSTSNQANDQTLVGPFVQTHNDDDVGFTLLVRKGNEMNEFAPRAAKTQSESDTPRERSRSQEVLETLIVEGPHAAIVNLASSVTSAEILQLRHTFTSQSNVTAFEQIAESLNAEMKQELIFEVPALAGASLTVGYVVWMLRGGMLITSLLAQMPAWRIIDPLVVLDSLENGPEDEESLGSLVEHGQSETDVV